MSVRDLIILGCSSQQPTRLRNHGGYLLRWNQEGLLFDPGEGTQRQFIFADVAPPQVTRIFVSHFHGDHCLGLGSMLLRLNLDKVDHPIHCYYPKSGKVYFDRLRYSTIYHDHIQVIEHPVSESGVVCEDDTFTIEAHFLKHGVDNIGWRIKEKDALRFHKDKLKDAGIKGLLVKELQEKGSVEIDGKTYKLADMSYNQEGKVFSSVIDTLPCKGALDAARGATLLLCESTYLEEHRKLAKSHKHLTAKQAAEIAKEAGAERLILTHFSARYRDLDPFVAEASTVHPNVDVADDFKVFKW